jgi:hypothetical protein
MILRSDAASRFYKGLIAATAIILVLVAGQGASAAAEQRDSWGIFSTDSTGLAYNSDLVLSHKGGGLNPCDGGFKTCTSPDDYTITNTLVPCTNTSKLACIESVSASTDGKIWVEGKRVGERVPNWDMYNYEARNDLGSPASHGPNLYKFEGITSDTSDLFDVTPRMVAISMGGKKFEINNISTRIQAVRNDLLSGRTTYLEPRPGLSGDNWLKAEGLCLDFPAITNDCWVTDSQTTPIYFKVKLALATTPDGWVSGRLYNPDVSFSKTGANNVLPIGVSVSGVSVVVPTLRKTYFAFNSDEKATWDVLGQALNAPWKNDGLSRGLSMSPLDIAMFTKGVSKDPSWNRATTERAEWVANLSWNKQLVGGSSCSTAGFEGFIGSNALVYESALPNFDSRTKELGYSVASPHYRVDGSAQDGVYSLLMSETFARCVWNTDTKLAKAQLSITSDDGNTKQAITTLTVNNGYLRFMASGFNFSKVSLRAKLSIKPTTITCVKGKQIKKVTGISPTCPGGFKKK